MTSLRSVRRLLPVVALLTTLSTVLAGCDDCAMSGDCTLAYKNIAPGSYCGRVGGVYCCCPLTMQCAATVFDCRCRNLPYPGYAPPQNLPMDRNDGLVVAIVVGVVLSLFLGAFCCVRHNCSNRRDDEQRAPLQESAASSLPPAYRTNRGYSHPHLGASPPANVFQRYDTLPATYGSALQQQHPQSNQGFDPYARLQPLQEVYSSYAQDPPFAIPVPADRSLQPSSSNATLGPYNQQSTYATNSQIPAYAMPPTFATHSMPPSKLQPDQASPPPLPAEVYLAHPVAAPSAYHDASPSAPFPPRQSPSQK